MFRIKTTIQSDQSVLHPEGTVRKISKPVKITELLGTCRQSRNNQPNSACKIQLPERLTPYLKGASNRKKNETNMQVNLSRSKKNVRRNLNFTKIPTPTVKTETLVTSKNNLIGSSREESSHLSTRRSLLIPPNTIKDLYIKNRFTPNKLILPQSYSVNDDKYHKIPEESESCSSPVKVTNMQDGSVIHEKVNKIVIQRISSQICTVNDQSGIGILYTNYTDTKDDAIGKESPESSINIEEKKCLFMTTDNCRKSSHQFTQDVQMINQPCLNLNHSTNKNDEYITINTNCIDTKNDAVEKEVPESSINIEEKKCMSMTTNNYRKDLHQSTQNVQMINQPCLNLNHSTNKNDDNIIINKTNLTDLASKLKHNICKLEEETLPNLRCIHTTIMDVLSTINITNKESDNNDTKIRQQMTENLNDHTKTTNNINTKLLCVSSNSNIENNINTEENIKKSIIIKDSNILKEISKTPDTNLIKFVETDVHGKNNSVIQSSHQIDISFEDNKENDSFVDLENQLDITNIKSSTTIISFKKSTPVLNKYQNKKEEKPLKEYMALKSRMSCLLTPNIKHFNHSQSKNTLHSESDDAKASLSGKILAELYHLYED